MSGSTLVPEERAVQPGRPLLDVAGRYSEEVLPAFYIAGQMELVDIEGADDARSGIQTRLFDVLITMLPDMLAEEVRGLAIERELAELTPIIETALAGQRAGYLVRVNLYAQEAGPTFSPAGAILSGVGVGLEPLDALAEAYRAPAIRATSPGGLRDESAYLWFHVAPRLDGTRGLTGAALHADFARRLEGDAWREARRRNLLQSVAVTTTPERLRRVEQAKLWTEVLRAREVAVADMARRAELQRLNERFEAVERQFNAAYEAYQRLERQAAAHAREMAVLDAIDSVLGIAKAGLTARAQRATDGKATAPPINNARMTEWGATRGQALDAARQAAEQEARSGLDRLNRAQDRLGQEWQRAGVPIPAMPRIQVELY